MFKLAILFCTIFFAQVLHAQVGINTPTPNSSSALDVTSTDKGILIPRLSKAQKNAIATPATGLLIYQNAPDSTGFHFYDGVKWNWLTATNNNNVDSSKWKITGTNIANKNTGNVGVNTGNVAPHSNLQVNGNIAVGVIMGLTGGTNAAPVSLANSKSYIGCLPADNTNNFYQLPDPAICAGRIYYIRNNSSANFVNLVTAAGLIFGGSSATAAGGNTYTLNPTTSVKTVICISDGTNWTVGKID